MLRSSQIHKLYSPLLHVFGGGVVAVNEEGCIGRQEDNGSYRRRKVDNMRGNIG